MNKKLFTLLLALVAIAMTAQAQNTNGHEYVDLGLPSGTLWATCNVGASKPEEYGDYFAWGETQPKKDYSLATYKWYSENEYTKYGNDGKTELDLEDDAANANWGGDWRMPSEEQLLELVGYCSWEKITFNGVNGWKGVGQNGNSIFLPSAGYYSETNLSFEGSQTHYYSRMLSQDYEGYIYNISDISGNLRLMSGSDRVNGHCVRPVVINNQSSELLLNAENFPDANFRAELASILGISEGDEITAEKIAATTSLDVNGYSKADIEKIADLTGIEHFTALTFLNCSENQLTSLDVSKNTALEQLRCSGNQLTTLDVSNNTELTGLRCYENQLTSLDVSKNPALEELNCGGNPLTSLDVSKNIALTGLSCWNNQLTSLDVSQNTALTNLHCHSNQLTSLDVSQNTALDWLQCYGNQLTSLDVSGCTALSSLECYGNQLTSLDVSQNTALTQLYCDHNQLTSLDMSQNTALKKLYCGGNQLTSLDVSGCTALKELACSSNQLTSLDVSQNTALTQLWCSSNQLTSLDVSQNTVLTSLSCYGNQLTSLDVSGCTALKELYCNNNQLTSLDVSQNTALRGLECYGNQIKGEAMDALVASLPTVTSGEFIVIDTKDENEGNICTKAQVAVAKGKGWMVYDYNGGNRPYPEYEGSDDATAKLLLNAEHFPDANFRAALASILGISEGDEITEAKISTTTYLNVYDKKIADLTGIEHFTALKTLYCSENQLTALDVSNNTALTGLYCSINQLNSLDVSKNSALRSLICNNNQLSSLDVLECTALTDLSCSDNQLTALDVSKNTALTGLYCFNNQLSSLDVSKNTALTNLHCYDNQLTSIDVSKNTALTDLRCFNNQLTSLDVSKNTALKWLYCNENKLTSFDVSKNTALTLLVCYSNQIKGEAMDALVASLPTVSKGLFYVINTKDTNEVNVCTKSQVAIAKGKGWKVYDYNGGPAQEYEGSDDATAKLLLNAANFPDANFRAALASILKISEGDEITAEKIAATTRLKVSERSISDLTGIEHFTQLKELYCYANQLTALDVSKNTALTVLLCYGNQLTALDVSKNTVLTGLSCYDNQLTALDVSKNTALTELWCNNNQLTSLNVSQNTALATLYCYRNQLTSLDVSNNTALKELECYYNQLTALDVSNNTALTYLSCSINQLTSLDVSKNTALTYLSCSINQLTSLDVSKNTALTRLSCDNNQLTALDVSKNTKLTSLWCFSNQIKGEAMDALVASLPTVEYGKFYVIDTKDENEGNVCTKAQVAIAKEKGWTVYDYDGGNYPYPEYEGSDPVEEDINPVDEDDNIDFGSDMDENDDLDGNVIGDIYYNINTGNGGYNAAEGCIVVKKPTDDGTVGELEGKDIFGEDFKSQFTGIVFKVPAGKGTIKVNAETTGNMLLKVKIGANDPVEMELNGKLKVTFPYNVSETTLVYIYAGAANEAKGFGAPASGDAALKIYGIEFIRDNTPTEINAVDSGELTVDSWYTIDGKKLAGEPKEKGIYIRNGRKVIK